MKTALVIVEGIRQIVLTPENDEEKNILALLISSKWSLQIKRGQFFICAAGYLRYGETPVVSGTITQDESVMLILKQNAEESK